MTQPFETAPPSLAVADSTASTRRARAIKWLIVSAIVLLIAWPMLREGYYRMVPVKDSIAWRTDYAAALDESAKTGKPVLIDFTAGWCPPCQVMKRQTWPDRRVGDAIAAGYIPLLLDVDQPTSREPAARYGVESIPTILIVDRDGNVLKSGGFMDAAELATFLAR